MSIFDDEEERRFRISIPRKFPKIILAIIMTILASAIAYAILNISVYRPSEYTLVFQENPVKIEQCSLSFNPITYRYQSAQLTLKNYGNSEITIKIRVELYNQTSIIALGESTTTIGPNTQVNMLVNLQWNYGNITDVHRGRILIYTP